MKQPPVVAVIPARYASTRLPGKPLISLCGKPMIQWVYESALRIPQVQRVLVATDDQRILETVQGFGGEAHLTPADIATGSERVGFLAKDIPAEIVVNLQGDEPLVDAPAVGKVVDTLLAHPEIPLGTLGCSLHSEAEWRNPSVVKLLVDHNMNAIYFSRAAIPYPRDEDFRPLPRLLRHIGVYVYRKTFLLEYLQWAEGDLERVEKLEQLRVLEKGYKIKVVKAAKPSPGVDTPEDVKRVEALIKSGGSESGELRDTIQH
ncbi:MAG: 3-deoxy-manno-octulosonate cytidylyltransferase [Calditrichaeota bacterium]|nr:3-deoxy-manno-octulosonate cytidylyltransferase [Calditrichota bacterium]MCB0294775.1 3-deoxy-manno-octulosonate cytidylyltransferase [Calditrichota bacterium]